jgi:hypothetical protein
MATGKRRKQQGETPLDHENAPKDQPTAPILDDEENAPAAPEAQDDHRDDHEVISPDGEPESAPKPVPLL